MVIFYEHGVGEIESVGIATSKEDGLLLESSESGGGLTSGGNACAASGA